MFFHDILNQELSTFKIYLDAFCGTFESVKCPV
jgi:hypothetical protein